MYTYKVKIMDWCIHKKQKIRDYLIQLNLLPCQQLLFLSYMFTHNFVTTCISCKIHKCFWIIGVINQRECAKQCNVSVCLIPIQDLAYRRHLIATHKSESYHVYRKHLTHLVCPPTSKLNSSREALWTIWSSRFTDIMVSAFNTVAHSQNWRPYYPGFPGQKITGEFSDIFKFDIPAVSLYKHVLYTFTYTFFTREMMVVIHGVPGTDYGRILAKDWCISRVVHLKHE